MTKLSVSVDGAVAEEMRSVVGPRGVSAFVTRAIRRELEQAALARYLVDLEVELGPPDQELLAEATAVLDQMEAGIEALGRRTRPPRAKPGAS